MGTAAVYFQAGLSPVSPVHPADSHHSLPRALIFIFGSSTEFVGNIYTFQPQPRVQGLTGAPLPPVAVGFGPGLGEAEADGDGTPGAWKRLFQMKKI